MKNIYKTLQNRLENRPRFDYKYLKIKCPEFMVNALQRNPHTQLFDNRHWWDNYPEVYTVKYDNNTSQLIPIYKKH